MPPSSNGPPVRRRPTGAGGSARPVRARSGPSEPRLICTAGPAQGSEFHLEGDEVVIGRAADNLVSIPDTSVSRKHVVLRKTAEGWAASDLGSGNGTLVNGVAITDETLLGSGDVLSMGDTELQFVTDVRVEGGGAPVAPRRPTAGLAARPTIAQPRARPVVRSRLRGDDPELRRKKRRLLTVVTLSAAVLVGIVFALQTVKERQDAEQRKHGSQAQERLDELRMMFQEAKNLVRDGKFEEAMPKLQALKEEDPKFNSVQVQQYIERVEKEIPNQKALADAKAAIEKGDIVAANEALQRVSADSQQFIARDNLKVELEKKFGAALNECRQLAASQGELGKMDQLLKLSKAILAVQPDHRDATEFKKLAETAIERIKNPYRPPPTPETPWVEVQDRFRSGDQAGAFSMANACAAKFQQCKTLGSQIQDYGEKYKRLESLSAHELVSLVELDRKISGGSPSTMSKQIGTRVAALYLPKASNAKAAGNWGPAIEFAKKVLWASPGNAEAQSILSEGTKQAKEVYLRAYQLKESDPEQAGKLFKEVMQMVSKDDEYYGKAQKQLSGLGN